MEPPEPFETYHIRHVLSGETVPLKVYFSRILWPGQPRKVPRMCRAGGGKSARQKLRWVMSGNNRYLLLYSLGAEGFII
jgi:hypothetical protein